MKSVLISIQPKWCELIASRKKTIEVRKTAPKEVPFKAYIYETKGKKKYWSQPMPIPYYEGKGKVIGEFLCDKIEECIPDYNPITQEFFYNEWEDSEATCLTAEEQSKYGKSKPLYGLHISELKIYDEPRELSEFLTRKCVYNGMCGKVYKPIQITRPPQSWCYVEEQL